MCVLICVSRMYEFIVYSMTYIIENIPPLRSFNTELILCLIICITIHSVC